MKNKKFIIIMSAMLAVLLIAGTVFCLTRPKNEQKPDSSDTTISDTEKDVVVDLPDNSETSGSDSESVVGKITDDGNALNPDESTTPTENKVNGEAAEESVAPTPEVEPPKEAERNENNDGLQIGDLPVSEPYSCGCENHHCNAPQTHAYILNLEMEGCPYCASHSCPSFYAVDEWGNACPNSEKCPMYNEKNDPIKYCSVCGKKNGDGSSGTCVQYICACNCPICGEWVEARVCHTCK